MNFWSTHHCSAMSAPLVSLFPDDADIAKTYLAMTQTLLNDLWIRISRRIWTSQRNRFSCWLMGPKGTVWWKKTETRNSCATVPLSIVINPFLYCRGLCGHADFKASFNTFLKQKTARFSLNCSFYVMFIVRLKNVTQHNVRIHADNTVHYYFEKI